MPRAVCPAQDQVANLHRRATELEQKIGKNLVLDAMRLHPWVIPQLASSLDSYGIVVKDEQGRRTVKPSSGDDAPKSFEAAARSRKKAAFQGPSPSKYEVTEEPLSPEDAIPTKYWTVDSLSPMSVSSKLLSVAEPACLSIANLKSITIKGRALENHQSHHRLLEFLSGLPGDFSLSGVYRSWSKLAALVQERNQLRGRRCRDISLPVDFDSTGLYGLTVMAGKKKLQVHHLYTKETVEFNEDVLPAHHTMDDIFVASNWSELRASLASRSDPMRKGDLLLITYFPNQEVCADQGGAITTRPIGKRPLAIKDAVADGDGEQVCAPAKRRSTKSPGAHFINGLAKDAAKKSRK